MFADSFLVIAATGNPLLDTLSKVLGVSVGFLVAFLVIFWISLIVWTFRDIRARAQDFMLQIAATLTSRDLLHRWALHLPDPAPAPDTGRDLRTPARRRITPGRDDRAPDLQQLPCPCRIRFPDLPLLRPKAQASLPKMRTATRTALGILPLLRHKPCFWANAEYARNASHAK